MNSDEYDLASTATYYCFIQGIKGETKQIVGAWS